MLRSGSLRKCAPRVRFDFTTTNVQACDSQIGSDQRNGIPVADYGLFRLHRRQELTYVVAQSLLPIHCAAYSIWSRQ